MKSDTQTDHQTTATIHLAMDSVLEMSDKRERWQLKNRNKHYYNLIKPILIQVFQLLNSAFKNELLYS